MATTPKKKPRKLIAARVSADVYERLLQRVARAGKRSGVPTNLGAVVRALLEEHA